jgi:hypothetical protein
LAANDVVVTGSRIPQPNLEREEGVARAEMGGSDEPSRSVGDRAYSAFVTRLQTAVRANDRNGVIALIDFPLRVNSNGRSRFYRDASSVRANYDRIFTPKVTQAVLGQRPDVFFGNQHGWMIGNGEVWFDHICTNARCSPPGPVRIKAVNL